MNNAHVTCPKCKEESPVESVEYLDIEENMQGKDVLTFVCPHCNEQVKALIWVRK